MTIEELSKICNEIMEQVRPLVPYTAFTMAGKYYSTGNMRFNAFKMRVLNDSVEIYVDEKIAPYVVYTNEPWVSPKWNGKKNPNEGWWDKMADKVAELLAQKVGGTIE